MVVHFLEVYICVGLFLFLVEKNSCGFGCLFSSSIVFRFTYETHILMKRFWSFSWRFHLLLNIVLFSFSFVLLLYLPFGRADIWAGGWMNCWQHTMYALLHK